MTANSGSFWFFKTLKYFIACVLGERIFKPKKKRASLINSAATPGDLSMCLSGFTYLFGSFLKFSSSEFHSGLWSFE